MILFSYLNELGGNGSKAIQCKACESLITHSDHLVRLNGRSRHSFMNNAGIESDSQTFDACGGAVAFGDPTRELSWFVGYAWRIAFCRTCGQHLGWHYKGLAQSMRPAEFWGILVARIRSA